MKRRLLSLHRENRVLEVTFRSPNTVNSLSNALMRELTKLAQDLQFDSDLNAIILTGAAHIFSAGMDLKDPESANASNLTLAQQRQLVKVGSRILPGDRYNELLVEVVNLLHLVDVLRLVHEERLFPFVFYFSPLSSLLPIP